MQRCLSPRRRALYALFASRAEVENLFYVRLAYVAGSPGHRKNPTPHVIGKWGWKDGWFSEAGLLAATEDEGESTEAEKGGGGGLRDGGAEHIDFRVTRSIVFRVTEVEADRLDAVEFTCVGGINCVAVEN